VSNNFANLQGVLSRQMRAKDGPGDLFLGRGYESNRRVCFFELIPEANDVAGRQRLTSGNARCPCKNAARGEKGGPPAVFDVPDSKLYEALTAFGSEAAPAMDEGRSHDSC
jgi:hypothetical protein